MKYFYINNQKFNYDLEFDTTSPNTAWKANAPIIEYCETLGITIPHYCYHKNLSISGNCRMCLIEIKKSPKPVVSCAMGAKSSLGANNEIFTNSPLVKKAREGIMEFLLLNHPLDCPICDQGGECDLQDQSLFFGFTKKRFYNFKRVVTDKNLGPIVKTVMTRCIHCTRCVRFASEVAGVEDLGIFGRGVNSEIGTYVDKIFQSELSGNVIDICPVGALTSKPYPFLGRNWELKVVKSIDPADGFGINLQVLLKNNQIVKVLPDYNFYTNMNEWISDKTRFIFDGMFSPNRRLNNFVQTGTGRNFELNSWKSLFKELILTFYFYDHLDKHLFEINPLLIIFNNSLPLETLSLLMLLSKKYKFIKLRTSEAVTVNNDIENNFQINTAMDKKLLENIDMCLLIGTNPRYDGNLLNLKIRQRYLKGNFKVYTLGAVSDLTYPTEYLGSNTKTLQSLAEGTHPMCKTMCGNRTLMITSSNLFKRNDFFGIFNTMQSIKSKKAFTFIDVLNTSLNIVGMNILNKFISISTEDLKNFSGLYLLDTKLDNINIKKIIELKLLNYFFNKGGYNKIFIDQNYTLENLPSNRIKSRFNFYNYTYLPNNVFFESSGSYIDNVGVLKKTVSLVSSLNNTKENWQILRKLFFNCKNITFINNRIQNEILTFNCNNFYNYRNYLSFIYLTSKSLSKTSFFLKNQNLKFKNPFIKIKLKRFFHFTELKKLIEDFYLSTTDIYSKNSSTMVTCSRFLRNGKLNFI